MKDPELNPTTHPLSNRSTPRIFCRAWACIRWFNFIGLWIHHNSVIVGILPHRHCEPDGAKSKNKMKYLQTGSLNDIVMQSDVEFWPQTCRQLLKYCLRIPRNKHIVQEKLVRWLNVKLCCLWWQWQDSSLAHFFQRPHWTSPSRTNQLKSLLKSKAQELVLKCKMGSVTALKEVIVEKRV